jgi:hypothetical protein
MLDHWYGGVVCFAAYKNHCPVIYCRRRVIVASKFVIDGQRFRCAAHDLLKLLVIKVLHAAIAERLTAQYMRSLCIDDHKFIYNDQCDTYDFLHQRTL